MPIPNFTNVVVLIKTQGLGGWSMFERSFPSLRFQVRNFLDAINITHVKPGHVGFATTCSLTETRPNPSTQPTNEE